jgi:hypothetical protein
MIRWPSSLAVERGSGTEGVVAAADRAALVADELVAEPVIPAA